MSIETLLDGIQTPLRQGSFISEASVSQEIVLPILHSLDWPVFDMSIVIPWNLILDAISSA